MPMIRIYVRCKTVMLIHSKPKTSTFQSQLQTKWGESLSFGVSDLQRKTHIKQWWFYEQLRFKMEVVSELVVKGFTLVWGSEEVSNRSENKIKSSLFTAHWFYFLLFLLKICYLFHILPLEPKALFSVQCDSPGSLEARSWVFSGKSLTCDIYMWFWRCVSKCGNPCGCEA